MDREESSWKNGAVMGKQEAIVAFPFNSRLRATPYFRPDYGDPKGGLPVVVQRKNHFK